MATKKPAKNIARKRAKVKKKRIAKKRVTSHTRSKKKKRGKKPQPKKQSKKRQKKQSKKSKAVSRAPRKRKVTRKAPPKKPSRKPIQIPKVALEHIDLAMMTQQVLDRVQEKIVIPGHWRETVESEMLARLIAAEQAGTFDETAYELAEEYDWEPNEVYSLWLSP